MKTIHAVSAGSYSDYRVLCVCSTPELAKAVAEKINALNTEYDGASVETMNFVESPDEVFTTKIFAVEINWDGQELKRWTFEQRSWSDYGIGTAIFHPSHYRTNVAARGVSDRDFDAALKAARDAVAQHKAKQANVA